MIIFNITNVTGSQSVLKGLLETVEAVSGPGYWPLWLSLCPRVGLDAAWQLACLQTLGNSAKARFWTGHFSFPKLFAECYFLVHGFFSFRNWDTSFVATWMDPEIVILSEVRQRRRNIIWHPLYVGSEKKQYKWTYLQNRNRLTGLEIELMVTRGES